MLSSTESSCEHLPHIHTHTKAYVLKLYMVNEESRSSLSSLAVMQMDDDLPVHFNVYFSMFKQWLHMKKYKNMLLVLLQNPFP